MKTLTTICSCLLLFMSALGQKDKDIPAWGKVEKADLEMKNCDFDKDAEAMVLFDVGELASFNFSPLELERRVRIKILNDKGLDHANIHLRYVGYHNNEQIKDLNAQTYNLDANGNVTITKVEKKQVFDKRINKYYSEVVFTFPEVKAGSIIEYKFRQINVGLVDWYFQRSIPVQYSRFTMDYPDALEIMAWPNVSLPLDSKVESKGTRTIKRYIMEKVPALRDEPFISCEDDYRQKVETKLIAYTFDGKRTNVNYTWPDVVKTLMLDDDFGAQLKKNIPRTADLEAALQKVNDPYSKMVIIHDYVRKNMEWDGESDLYARNGVKAAWKDKKGNSGEINLILVNLLKDAGLYASPLLVSTRENGRINTLNPNINDFDKVIAFVTIDNHHYLLDATDKYTPPSLIPPDIMYSEGLVIEKYETYEWGWQMLWDEKQQYKTLSLLKLDINDAGQLTGEINLNSYDYARIERAPALKKGKEKFMEQYFSASNPGIQIDSFNLLNDAVDTLPLIQKIKFHEPLASSGDYKYFNVNMFTGFEKNPFVASQRFSDVFFGMNQNHNIVAVVNIPDDYVFEELPKSIRMIMPDTSISITRRVAANEHQLSVRINLEFKKPFFGVNDYENFKEFYKKLIDILSEQYVIRKKANP